MKPNFALARETVALESLSNDVSNLLGRVFPAIHDGFSQFVGMFDKQEQAAALTSDQRTMLKHIGTQKYLDVADLTAYCPSGLNTSLLVYSEALSQAVDHCSMVYNKISPEYKLMISRLINQEDYQLDTRNVEGYYKSVAKDREDVMKHIGACFKKGSTETKCTLESLVQRNSDWNTVFTRIDAINTVINKIDRSKLSKSIKEITDLMDALANKIKRGELEKVSPAVIHGISEGAYQLASELEMYAAIHYRVLELNATVNQTVEHYIKSTKH